MILFFFLKNPGRGVSHGIMLLSFTVVAFTGGAKVTNYLFQILISLPYFASFLNCSKRIKNIKNISLQHNPRDVILLLPNSQYI